MMPRRIESLVVGLGVSLMILTAAQLSGCVDTSVFTDAVVPTVDSSTVDGEMTTLDGLKSIVIEPADAVLEITDSNPVTQTFKALGTFEDGEIRDVTDRTEFFAVSPRVGVFNGPLFTSAVSWGGTTTVEATTANGITGSTSLTVIFKRRFTNEGVDSELQDQLAEATDDVAHRITLVYPPDGVLVPPNLVDLEIQWVPAAGQEIYEIAFQNEGTDIRIYTPCNAIDTLGCGYVPNVTEWQAIVLAIKGDLPAQVVVRGASSTITNVGRSNERELHVAEEEIKGGLYYWNATPGSVVRYDFGESGQKAKNFYTAFQAKAMICVGCHAMSLDGKKMAVGLDMPAPSPLQIVDVETRTVLAQGAANFMAFSPDGEKIITSDGNSMVLREADTLTAIAPTPLRAKGTMADWSADGKKVVYVEPGGTTIPLPFGQPGTSQGSLKLVHYDPNSGAWSATQNLVASQGENNYYPTWSPDNELVIFNRAGGDSYDAPDAALWAVRADGSTPPMELKKANQGPNLCNSWPKFSPYIQSYKGGQLLWFTFSSRRPYGLRIPAPTNGDPGRAQLWMAAIDLAKDEILTDPSYPAFWLPFQDIKTGNHIAQWVMEVVRKPCGLDGDCPEGQTCVANFCEPN